MEVDQFLLKVQGILKNEQRTLGNLHTMKRDNLEDVQKVLGALDKTLECNSLDEKAQQKLYLILFFNIDTDIYSDLKKNRKLAHLVGLFPKLSKDLFMKIVIHKKLHKYLYESVAFFPPVLVSQVVDISLSALCWLDLFESIDFVENLLFSLFCKIVTTDDGDKYNAYLKDLFQTLLLHYDIEKGGAAKRMTSWKSSKLKHYGGLVMGSLFSLLENCTKVFCEKEVKVSVRDSSVYSIQIDTTGKAIPNSGSQNRLMSTQQCYEHIVAKCLENMCSITVDLWLFWVEIDLDDVPDTENTLQRLVGEKAYTCCETLKEAEENFGVSSKEALDLRFRMKNIALKPQADEDKASDMSLDVLLENIQDPAKDTQKWLRFLLKNASFVIEEKTLDVIKTNITCLQDEDIQVLSELIFSYIKSNKSCAFQKRFIIDVVKILGVGSQMAIVKSFVKEFGFSEVLKTETFQPVFVETFNKVINEEDKERELYPEFVSLALQSGEAVLSRAVAEGITSEVRGHLMADILGKLQPFCDAVKNDGSSLLISALYQLLVSLPDAPENQHRNYPLFVRELVMRKILKGDRFVTDCIFEHIDLHLKSKNWTVLNASMETISELLDIDCVPSCLSTLAVLVMALEATRWTPCTFNMAAVQVCDLTQQLIAHFVVKWFKNELEDKGMKNMVVLMQQRISPLNRYNLQRLLPEEPMPTDDPALQLMYRIHYGIGEWTMSQVSQEERVRLVYSLCFVLPVLTPTEWTDLFCIVAPMSADFFILFNIVVDSLLLCVDSAKVKNDPVVISCLSHATSHVTQAVKCELIRWTENDNDFRITSLSRLCQLLSNFPMPEQEELGNRMVKVLIDLLPKGSRGKSLSAEEMNNVTASIASLQAPSTRQALAKEFLEMVHR